MTQAQLTKKEKTEAEEKAWKINPKNPRVVFDQVTSTPVKKTKPLDKPILIGVVCSIVVIVALGVLKLYTGVFIVMLISGLLAGVNAAVNHNPAAKIFAGVTLIGLLGVIGVIITHL